VGGDSALKRCCCHWIDTGFAQAGASFSASSRLFVIRCLAWEEIEYMGSHEPASSSDLSHPSFDPVSEAKQSPEELKEEQRKLRRLQMMMDMVMSVIGQDTTLTIDEASEMVADSRRAALAMFPDKELAYDLIYKPRLQRLMRERYRIQ
jgi:hypothetical protein